MNKKIVIIFQSIILFLVASSFILTDVFMLKLLPKSNYEIDKNVESNIDSFYSTVKKTYVSMIVPDSVSFNSYSEIKKINPSQIESVSVDSHYTLKVGVNSYLNKGDVIASNGEDIIKSNHTGRIVNIHEEHGIKTISIDLISNYYLQVEVPTYYYKIINHLNESENRFISISIGNYTSKATIFSCTINDRSNYELIINEFEYNPNVYDGFRSYLSFNYITGNFLAFPKECIIKRIGEDLILAKKIVQQNNESIIEDVTLKLANSLLILQDDFDYSDYCFVENPRQNQGYYLTLSSNF